MKKVVWIILLLCVAVIGGSGCAALNQGELPDHDDPGWVTYDSETFPHATPAPDTVRVGAYLIESRGEFSWQVDSADCMLLVQEGGSIVRFCNRDEGGHPWIHLDMRFFKGKPDELFRKSRPVEDSNGILPIVESLTESIGTFLAMDECPPEDAIQKLFHVLMEEDRRWLQELRSTLRDSSWKVEFFKVTTSRESYTIEDTTEGLSVSFSGWNEGSKKKLNLSYTLPVRNVLLIIYEGEPDYVQVNRNIPFDTSSAGMVNYHWISEWLPNPPDRGREKCVAMAEGITATLLGGEALKREDIAVFFMQVLTTWLHYQP